MSKWCLKVIMSENFNCMICNIIGSGSDDITIFKSDGKITTPSEIIPI